MTTATAAAVATGNRGGGRTPIDMDTVVAMTWAGKTARQIAEVLGCDPRSVSRVRVRARRAGVPLPAPDHIRSDCRAGRGNYTAAAPPGPAREVGEATPTRDTGIDWRHRAACRDEDPDLFFTETLAAVEEAKAVCRRCPVRLSCLDWAVETGQTGGVFGGATEDERRVLARRRKTSTHHDEHGEEEAA